MRELFFANYCLLVDDAIACHESMRHLSEFEKEMPYTHTFSLRIGEPAMLDERYEEASRHALMCATDSFAVHDDGDTWSIVRLLNETVLKYHMKCVVTASRDYGEMVLYLSDEPYWCKETGRWEEPYVPFSSLVRTFCEAGMVTRGGLPLHASMVEKDGCGIVFLGPSGMGKSTQAKQWAEYQDADFIIGDRPVLRCVDGTWLGFGMPWDGKDNITNQRSVPIKALVTLEQAKGDRISKLDERQAMVALLNQAMMPMWDEAAMDGAMALMERLSTGVPFYHLENLPGRHATELTYKTVFEGV